MIQQFNVFIVGKYYSKSELGLFNRGNRFPDLIVNILQSVLLKMTLPLFAKLQDHPNELFETIKKTNKAVAFISFPLLILLLIKAEDLTIFLFTEKWRGSIIFLQLFCIVKILEPFISIHREVILAQGLSKLLFRLFIILSFFEIGLIFLAVKFGIIYLVAATFISRIAQYVTYTVINSKRMGKSWLKELGWYVPYIMITGIMAIAVILSQYIIGLSHLHLSLFIKLSLQLSLGISVYLFLAYRLKIEETSLVESVIRMVSQKLKRQPTS